MKPFLPRLAGAIALSALLALNAHAEQYQGVLRFQSTATRAEVRSQAITAAHGADPYREGAYAQRAPAIPSEANRSDVKVEARAAARSGNPYGDVAGDGVARVANGTVDRQAVRAEAHAAAARGVTEGLQ